MQRKNRCVAYLFKIEDDVNVFVYFVSLNNVNLRVVVNSEHDVDVSTDEVHQELAGDPIRPGYGRCFSGRLKKQQPQPIYC